MVPIPNILWPDGTRVSTSYTVQTRWLDRQVVTTGARSARVYYLCDEWGLPAGWTGGEKSGGSFDQTTTRDGPTRVAGLTWATPNGGYRSIDYAYALDGMLQSKDISGSGLYEYAYDDLQRVVWMSRVSPGPSISVLERYTYDNIGNPLNVTRLGEGTWAYDRAEFSEIPGRTNLDTGESETHTWDAAGRMQTWNTFGVAGSGGRVDTKRSYAYDGAGRLVHVLQQMDTYSSGRKGSKPSTHETEAIYGYDVDDQMVLETHFDSSSGGLPSLIYRFQVERVDTGGHAISKVLPMVSVVDGELRWTFTEADGHALETYASNGGAESFEVLGVYGVELPDLRSGNWPIDGFHGSDPEKGNRLVPRGARVT